MAKYGSERVHGNEHAQHVRKARGWTPERLSEASHVCLQGATSEAQAGSNASPSEFQSLKSITNSPGCQLGTMFPVRPPSRLLLQHLVSERAINAARAQVQQVRQCGARALQQ